MTVTTTGQPVQWADMIVLVVGLVAIIGLLMWVNRR